LIRDLNTVAKTLRIAATKTGLNNQRALRLMKSKHPVQCASLIAPCSLKARMNGQPLRTTRKRGVEGTCEISPSKAVESDNFFLLAQNELKPGKVKCPKEDQSRENYGT